MTRVLVVEDHPLNFELVQAVLEEMPMQIDWATDVTRALEDLARTPYDLVLLDWHLPRGSGENVLREMARMPHRPACVVLTADARPELLDRARDLGADEVLTKPIVARTLLATIERAIGRSSGQEG